MERGHDESAPKHPTTACACRECAPERFAGKRARYAQPRHMCQRCFIGQCEANATAKPRTDGRWTLAQLAHPEQFARNTTPEAEAE